LRSARDHGLDAARAIAIMCVVAGHAVASFMVTPIGWAIQDRSRFLGADLAAWIIRAFAMPTFFWLAGYFSRALLVDAGARAFVASRITRIFVPLALLLVPMSVVVGELWDWGREVATRAAVPDHIPRLRSSELEIFLGHLWFLYYLLWLSLAALVIARVARSVPARLPVLAVPAMLTIGVLGYLGTLHTDTPLGFIPDLPILLYMGAFFAWGWLVHARPDELARYARRAWPALAIAAVLLGVVIVTLYRGLHASEPPPLYGSVASALFTIAVMVFLLGACVRYLVRPRPLLRLASRSSYWCYVVHLPVAVLLQILLARVTIPGPLKYLAILTATASVCVASYMLVARRAPRSARNVSRSSEPHR
jgi:glucans biosynthesis protein C